MQVARLKSERSGGALDSNVFGLGLALRLVLFLVFGLLAWVEQVAVVVVGGVSIHSAKQLIHRMTDIPMGGNEHDNTYGQPSDSEYRR